MTETPILIIDDEVAVLEGISEFLEDEGYRVHGAVDGATGLALFRALKPELVLTDLRMPGMSGLELIGEIRKVDQDTPVIVLTGYGSLDSAIHAIHLKVFDFLTKPIDLSSLKSTIERARRHAMETRRIQSELLALREQLSSLQNLLKDQLAKFSEVEPLLQASRLLTGVLHDLNNPLTHIMGQAELLHVLHPEIQNIEVIQKQAERIKAILGTVMQRLKASQNRRLEWVQINEVLKNEVLFLECHPFFKNEIEKEWQLDHSLPNIRGVPAELSQVFGNILRNAAEAMIGEDTRRLVIRSWSDTEGIHVSIRDTGPGIPPPLQEKIFLPFFTTKGAGSGIVGSMGMGIGLYYCEQLMAQYGGHIEVLSDGRTGATFVVHFPVSGLGREPAP